MVGASATGGAARHGTGVMSVRCAPRWWGRVCWRGLECQGPSHGPKRPGASAQRDLAMHARKSNRLAGPDPNGPFRAAPTRARIGGMQVLASTHAQAGRPTRRHVVSALGIGLALVVAAAALLYLVFLGNFLDRFMPAGRPSTYELVAGALAWT